MRGPHERRDGQAARRRSCRRRSYPCERGDEPTAGRQGGHRYRQHPGPGPGDCPRAVGLWRPPGGGGAVAAQLQQHGVRALYCATDIERDEEIDKCVARTIDSFGRLDILVNNACTYADRGFDAGRAEWLQSLNVNLVSAAIFTQKAVVHMRRGSVIVNLGSTGGKFGAAGRALYPAAKAALLQMTKNLAVTLAPRGIRAVAVSPAWTWSPAI